MDEDEGEAIMNAKQIAQAIESGGFDRDDVRTIGRALERAARDAEARELSWIASAASAEIVERYAGDWGCYHVDDAPKAVRALNARGVRLVKAVRSGDATAVKAAIRAVRRSQEKWSHTGSDDTEGREALWRLLRNACRGSELNASAIWESSYGA
jgi:hypothetical protein